jgi:hypothetical protein
MAFFGFVVLLGAIWMNIILPLFYNFAAFRWFALFLIVSVVAVVFGGVMSSVPSIDQYRELDGTGDTVSGD